MRRWTAIAVLASCWVTLLSPTVSLAQQEQPETKRKVINRVVPLYPEMARTMNLRGNVKVEALVATNGTVKSVEIKGGHPLLVQAAENAIRKWKWEPAGHETREPIEVKFDPH
ncbi:MAG: energy transducer TonB [Acidobacteriia bacterium]|nr:energy transducer TonB [Terriglobia bacterium]